jgi:hypothetical protein
MEKIFENDAKGPCLNTILVFVGSPHGLIPPGGVWWLMCTPRGGGFAPYKNPLVGRRGWGLGGGENCGESTKLLDVS